MYEPQKWLWLWIGGIFKRKRNLDLLSWEEPLYNTHYLILNIDKNGQASHWRTFHLVCVCLCVCVCKKEERERIWKIYAPSTSSHVNVLREKMFGNWECPRLALWLTILLSCWFQNLNYRTDFDCVLDKQFCKVEKHRIYLQY